MLFCLEKAGRGDDAGRTTVPRTAKSAARHSLSEQAGNACMHAAEGSDPSLGEPTRLAARLAGGSARSHALLRFDKAVKQGNSSQQNNPATTHEPSRSRLGARECGYYACCLAGIAALGSVAMHYRIDQIQPTITPSTGWMWAIAYWLAVALLAVAWIGLARLCIGKSLLPGRTASVIPPAIIPTGWRILVAGLAVNALAIVCPPFLSDDPLAYAAVGRAQTVYERSPYTPLKDSLPLGDPFRQSISKYSSWLSTGSVYAPGFNWIGRQVARIAGDNLLLNLRLFQVVGLIFMVLTAIVAGQAAGRWNQARYGPGNRAPGNPSRGQATTQAMAIVLFCPLSIIDGSINAHNDSMLALSVALFALCVVYDRRWLALVPLAAAMLVKASALLLLGFYGVHLLVSQRGFSWHRRSAAWKASMAVLALAGGAATLWMSADWLEHHVITVVRLLGNPADTYPYCTRSIECAPRALLHFVLKQPTAAWLVGLGFRAASAVLLLYLAARSKRGAIHLASAGVFIFLYYLYFHAHSHPWYVLSLLPLIPFADPRLRPAMFALAISNPAYYGLDLMLPDDTSMLAYAVNEIVGGLIVVLPPTLLAANWMDIQANRTAERVVRMSAERFRSRRKQKGRQPELEPARV